MYILTSIGQFIIQRDTKFFTKNKQFTYIVKYLKRIITKQIHETNIYLQLKFLSKPITKIPVNGNDQQKKNQKSAHDFL